MQRLMRAAIGTHNIDNCSRVCHSPTSWAMRKSLRPVGRDRLVRRHRRRRRGDHHRREPDRGPSRRRRADQAGDAARPQARDDRPAADRARRLRRAAPRAAPGLATPRSARPRARRRARRAHRRRLPRRAHRGLRRARASCSRTTPRPTSSASAASRRRTSSAPRTSTPRRARRACCGGLASPSTATARRSCGSSATSRSCAARSAGRARALLPLRGQNNVQGSSDMGALPDTFTGYQSVADDDVARALRSRLGRDDEARARAEDPRDVRRSGRRRPQGHVHLRRGRRADRSEHDARHQGPASRSSSSSCRRSSRTRRRATPTSSCPRRRSSRRQARSRTPSGACSSWRPRSTRPATRARTSRSSRRSRRRSGTRCRSPRPPTSWTRSRR